MITIILLLFLTSILFLYLKRKKTERTNYVYMNEKSKKYHLKGCPYAKNLNSIPLETAIKDGYLPCQICNPK